MINDYPLYLALALTVTAIPGPAVLLTIRNSITYGYRIAIMNVIGNSIAMVILASLSAAGLGAVILASSTLFYALKVIGCLYLIYLGIMAWRAQYIHENTVPECTGDTTQTAIAVFKEGFGVGITNPKAIAFFTALFPQFIDPSRSFIPQFSALIGTIEGISFIVLTVYALLSSLASPYLSRARTMTVFNKITGTCFIGFGLALVYDE